jgi:hypothetical protein
MVAEKISIFPLGVLRAKRAGSRRKADSSTWRGSGTGISSDPAAQNCSNGGISWPAACMSECHCPYR